VLTVRAVILGATLSAVHFLATGTLGVVAFITQGDLTSAGPPTFAHVLVSAVVNVLELPLVTAVRWLSPEALAGFLPTAIANSILWGVAAVVVSITQARASSVVRPVSDAPGSARRGGS
jgi:hypothetical protein